MKNLQGQTVQTKNGELAVVELVTVKDVTLVFDATGETKKISIHSFKRNWTPCAEQPEAVAETEEVETEGQEEELLEDEAGEGEEESDEETAEDEQDEADTEVEEPAPVKPARPIRSTATATKPEKEVKAEKPAKEPKAPKAPKEVKPAKDPSLQGVFDSVLEYAEGLGCETKETFKYTAIRHRKKNIAELHYNKQGVALVISSKSLSKELNKECIAYPTAYNWVLDTKFMVGSDSLNTAYEIIEAGIAHVDASKPVGKGEKAKAEKADKKASKEAK